MEETEDSITASQNVNMLGIKWDQLQPPPWWTGRVLDEEKWKRVIAIRVMNGAKAVGRSLTEDETDARAEHDARLVHGICQSFGYSILAGAAFATVWEARRRLAPGQQKFKSSRSWLPSMGRGVGCILFALFVTPGSLLFALNDRNCERMSQADPRLRTFYREVMAKQPNARSASANRPSVHAPTPSLPLPKSHGTQFPQMEEQQDFSERFPQDAPQAETRPQVPRRQTEATSSLDEDPFLFDDASPVAPQHQRSTQQQNVQQSGSPWDRLRNQARAEAAARRERGQENGEAIPNWTENTSKGGGTSQHAKRGNSYSFSSDDQERAFAKDQAQKDFDAMLEKERRADSNPRKW